MIANGKSGYFPYTPATNLLYGLREALKMLLDEEGLDAVFAATSGTRKRRDARCAPGGWRSSRSTRASIPASLTAVLMPAGHDADRVRKVILEAFDMSLGTGLTKLGGKVFRIGHLGDFNDLTLMGTLAGVEMGLGLAGVPVKKEGVQAAMDYLAAAAAAPARKVA